MSDRMIFTTTIGVNPPHENRAQRTLDDEIPLATLAYAVAMARQANEMATLEGKKATLNIYANDLSRLAVSLAKQFGVQKLAAALEMAFQVPNPELDHTGLDQSEIDEERESIVRGVRGRIAVILAGKEYVPLLRETVGEVDSIIEKVGKDPDFARFVVKFMKAVTDNFGNYYGMREDGTVKRLLMCLLPPSLRPDLENEAAWDAKLPDAMYAPAQAAAGVYTMPHLTYSGPSAGNIPGRMSQTIGDLTRMLGAQVLEKFMHDSEHGQRVNNPDNYFCSEDPQAFGWAFTSTRKHKRAAFYMKDINGDNGHGSTETPQMMPLIAIQDGNLQQALDADYWCREVASEAGQAIRKKGVREALSLVVDPVLRDVVTRDEPNMKILRRAICIEAGMSDKDVKRLERWTSEERAEVCGDRAYNALVLSLAAGIADKAREIFTLAR